MGFVVFVVLHSIARSVWRLCDCDCGFGFGLDWGSWKEGLMGGEGGDKREKEDRGVRRERGEVG